MSTQKELLDQIHAISTSANAGDIEDTLAGLHYLRASILSTKTPFPITNRVLPDNPKDALDAVGFDLRSLVDGLSNAYGLGDQQRWAVADIADGLSTVIEAIDEHLTRPKGGRR